MKSLMSILPKQKVQALRAVFAARITRVKHDTLAEVANAYTWTDDIRKRPSTLIAALAILMFSASAQAATDGATLWGQLKGMWFGAPGLIIGAVILVIGVIGFFRNGFGWTSVVFGISAAFFMVPGVAIGLQSYAAGIAGP
jgi:hypothetical protein